MNFSNLFKRAIQNPGAIVPFVLTLPRQLRLLSRLMGDGRVPLGPKLMLIGALVYLISPIDLIPDFLFPVLGWTDDFFVVIAAARHLVNAAPPDVLQEHAVDLAD